MVPSNSVELKELFTVSGCAQNAKVKFSTFTLKDEALTWWNNYRKSVGDEVAYAMTWEQFKDLLIKTYCPRNEIKKLEIEFWNHKVKGSDLTNYNRRYQELSLLCPDMVKTEALKIERYTDGLPLATRNDVIAARPANLHEAISIAQSLMDSIALENPEKGKKDKRKRNDHAKGDDKPNKRQETAKAYALGNGEKQNYEGTKRLCGGCHRHHYGHCAVICKNCSKPGHLAKDCRSRPLAMVQTAQGNDWKATVTCFGCGKKGHYRNECRETSTRGNNGNGTSWGNRGAGSGGQHPNHQGTGWNRGIQVAEAPPVEAGAAQARV